MDKFDLECDNLLEASKCSARLFEKLGIDAQKVEGEVDASLYDLRTLQANKEMLDFGGITSLPAASINNLRVPGNLKVYFLL